MSEFELNVFLEIFLVLELDISAAFAVRTVEGEIFSLIRPRHVVAEDGHVADELVLAAAI